MDNNNEPAEKIVNWFKAFTVRECAIAALAFLLGAILF